jgi:hypothetical protein
VQGLKIGKRMRLGHEEHREAQAKVSGKFLSETCPSEPTPGTFTKGLLTDSNIAVIVSVVLCPLSC